MSDATQAALREWAKPALGVLLGVVGGAFAAGQWETGNRNQLAAMQGTVTDLRGDVRELTARLDAERTKTVLAFDGIRGEFERRTNERRAEAASQADRLAALTVRVAEGAAETRAQTVANAARLDRIESDLRRQHGGPGLRPGGKDGDDPPPVPADVREATAR